VLDERAVAEYARRGVRELTPGQQEMCRLPEGCELICAPDGGPPGFRIDNLYVLPGVPSVLKAMWPGIAARFSGPREHTASFEVRIGESRFAGLMREFAQRHPQFRFGSYPHLRADGWVVELRVRGSDAALVQQAAREFEAAIAGLAG
jgi:molybdopterin-biosynthesis enzyme MoeA-like protein